MDKTIDKNYQRTEKALYDYEFLKKYILLRKKDLDELDYEGVSAIFISLAKSSNHTISDPVSEEYFNVEKVRKTWQTEISRNESKINKINVALGLLNNIERKIVEMRYFQCIRIYTIAEELDYSEKQISRIKKNAVNKISIVLWGREDITQMSD